MAMNTDGIVLKVEMAYERSEAGLGRVRMDAKSRSALGVEMADFVEIIGKRSTAAKVFKADKGDGVIYMDSVLRECAGVGVGDTVRVVAREKVAASRVTLAPDLPEGRLKISGDKEQLIRKGLESRPIMSGDKVDVPNIFLAGCLARYTVINTVPAGVVTVTESTVLDILDEPAKAVIDKTRVGITYDDVGGLDDELRRIRDMIELPLKHPEVFERLGITPPKGVLLYGPPGTGKTLIAKALARESGASFHSINGPEIVGKYYGESEEQLRTVFERAEASAPSIVFIDEIDSIAPIRDEVYGDVEKRIVAQLLTLMDGMSVRNNVVVIAATNREDAIDPALRRPGRFDREIEIGVPNRAGRTEILGVHLRGMPLAEDVDIEKLAAATQGFVGADLAALAREAAMKCLGRYKHLIDMNSDTPAEIDMTVTMKDFTDALAEIDPSAMREITIDVPDVSWDDIGGLDSIKNEIKEVFVPAEEKKDFQRLGIKTPKGVLLYGPPGTGKTMIAKAAANESGANFICINGPEIASKWLGESEKAIRQAFKKAKQIAPCILFFDEFDAVAPRRGGETNGAWEKVVNQLLTSMDGVEALSNVTVMAATNRPDMIDPALLRPGRFDKKIYIGVPDRAARVEILKLHSKDMPLKDVDMEALADMTDGFVGADISELCREAGMCAYNEDHSAEYVTMRHFETVLKTMAPSVSKDDLRHYESLKTELNKRKASYSGNPLYG